VETENEEDGMGEQKQGGEVGKGDEGQGSGHLDPRFTAKGYVVSRKAWKDYLAGKLTAGELEELLGQMDEETMKIMDTFDGRLL